MAVYNCSCLAQDLGKMFEVYWALGLPNATIPSPWPERFSTSYNKERPLELMLNGTKASVYLSVSALESPHPPRPSALALEAGRSCAMLGLEPP